jgi:hypothetical protein
LVSALLNYDEPLSNFACSFNVRLYISAVYLQSHPDSALAINLKACNHFRLYNGGGGARRSPRLTRLVSQLLN